MRLQKIATLLCGVCLLGAFASCGTGGGETPGSSGTPQGEEDRGTLVVCVDPMIGELSGPLRRFKEMNHGLEVVVEEVPYDHENTTEREAYLTSLRVEILAGKGPDVLLMTTSSNFYDSLFGDENKAMANGIFADLRDWLPAEELESLHPALLKAGEYRGAQCILPLEYSVDGLLFSEASYAPAAHLFFEGQTAMEFAGALPELYTLYDEPYPVGFSLSRLMQAGMVEYEADTITFDDAVLRPVLEANRLAENMEPPQWESGIIDVHDPNNPLVPLAEKYIYSSLSPRAFYMFTRAYKHAEESPVPLPIPNAEGGYTAQVASYAAIPATSNNKQAAADLIALLVSEEYQRTILAKYESMPWDHAMPVRLGCMQRLYEEQKCGPEIVDAMLRMEENITNACFVPRDFLNLVEDAAEKYYSGQADYEQTLEAWRQTLTKYF